MRAAARLLAERGERIAIITNDQGEALVDTALCAAPDGGVMAVTEIGGGCFCCRYAELEQALLAAADAGATVALAEAVGSCTDLVATVLAALVDRRPDRFSLAPLAVLVDPWRAQEIAAGAFPADVQYLFRKQIEEADIVVITRSDLDPPDAESLVREIRGDAPVVHISSVTGAGVADWLAAQPLSLAQPLVIDYDRYAAAEALLGWANGRIGVLGNARPKVLVERLFAALADQPIAHLKVYVEAGGATGSANLVRQGGTAVLALDDLPAEADGFCMVLNARVAVSPEALEPILAEAVAEAADPIEVVWSQLDCFAPGRPVPVHRYTERCDPFGDAACCAAFYQRPDVAYLLGDSYHPGGTKLTLEMAEQLDLAPGAQVLDVACGLGTSLKALVGAYGIGAVGLDTQPGALGSGDGDGPGIHLAQGDAHAIPFEAEAFDALLCECALSTFADQPRALSEMLRVLRPGGSVAFSDMVANGPVPDGLRDWVHLGTCLLHARSIPDYRALVEAAGFEVLEARPATWALRDLISGIKRRLLGLALARTSGALPSGAVIDVKQGRALLKQAAAVIDEGTVDYGVLIARKPLSPRAQPEGPGGRLPES